MKLFSIVLKDCYTKKDIKLVNNIINYYDEKAFGNLSLKNKKLLSIMLFFILFLKGILEETGVDSIKVKDKNIDDLIIKNISLKGSKNKIDVILKGVGLNVVKLLLFSGLKGMINNSKIIVDNIVDIKIFLDLVNDMFSKIWK